MLRNPDPVKAWSARRDPGAWWRGQGERSFPAPPPPFMYLAQSPPRPWQHVSGSIILQSSPQFGQDASCFPTHNTKPRTLPGSLLSFLHQETTANGRATSHRRQKPSAFQPFGHPALPAAPSPAAGREPGAPLGDPPSAQEPF